MGTRVDQLTEKIERAKHALKDLADRVDGESGEWSAEDRQTATAILADIKSESEALDRAKEELRLRADIDAIFDIGLPNGNGNGNGKTLDLHAAVRKSLGEQFVESSQFQGWMKTIAPSGVLAENTKGLVSPPFPFAGYKTLITGLADTSAGAMVFPDRAPMVDLPTRPLAVRDIVTVGRTTSDTIEYVRVESTTNNAAPVPEADTTGASGVTGQKPESAIVMKRETATVKTIAHWIPATKRALADAAQLRTLVDNFLRSGLEEELEDQMVSGDGTGENFLGIANTPGVQAQAWDTDILTTTRKARTKVQVVGRATPTAYLLNPYDWEAVDLTQDNEARYYFGGPMVLGTPRLWGLPVVTSEGVPQGTGYVGDFRSCVLWDREQATITVSDSHADFFTRNIVAILGELRAAFGILRPVALVEMDLTAA